MRMRFSQGFTLVTLSMAWAGGVSAQAAAPAESKGEASKLEVSGLEELVVTARRVAENLQSVPVAVTAISEETLRQERIIDVANLQRVTPSLTVTTTSRGGSTPVYMIRGQRAFTVNTATEPAVTVYFADVGQSLPTGTNLSLYDLSSVQVLKGPQGTLFGRNTTGGALLFTPAAPSSELEGYGQGVTGSDELMDFEGVLNVPLTDTLAIRAAGKIQRRDGYLTNPVRGDEAGDLNAESGRLSLRWQPSAAFESTLIGTYYNDDVQGATRLFRVDPTRIPASLGPFRAALGAQYQQALAQITALGDYEFNDASPQYSKNRVWSVQNTSVVTFSPSVMDELSIKNIAGYRDINTQYQVNTEGSPLAVINYPGLVDVQQFSDELQLIGVKGNLDFVGGLFYYKLEAKDQAPSSQFASLAALVPTVFPVLSVQSYEPENTSYAAFVHANYKLDALLEGFSISGGARITKDERDIVYHNRSSGGANPVLFTCTLTGQTGLPNSDSTCSTPASTDFTEPTYDLSLNYQVTADVLTYLAYRHGYRSGGFNTSPPSVALIPAFTFKPETVDDFELGVKTEFGAGGWVGRLNVAAFRSDYSDIQRTSNVTLPGASTITSLVTNAAEANITGGEVELTLQPTDALTLTLNGAYLDAKYDTWTDTYSVGGVPTVIDISDSKFVYVPETQLNASINYVLPLDESLGTLSVRGGYYYQDEVQTGEISTRNCGPDGLYPYCNQVAGALPSYELFNARIDWRNVAGLGFDVALFVDNVADKYYRPDALNLLGALGLAAETVAPPRMYGLELRVPFGASGY